jgi:hypothetical protein
MKSLIGAIAAWLLILSLQGVAATLLVETEQFDHYGGWVLDQQFMDEMGSPFLLAHGLGFPVDDATAVVTFPEVGTYKVWVRTRDWTGWWKEPFFTDTNSPKYSAGSAPGKFEVLVDQVPLAPAWPFGSQGADWHWQDGGTIGVTGTQVEIRLRDLTGFEGRCDAIFFTTDMGFVPPNEDPAMDTWRQSLLGTGTVTEAGNYDLVVVGGGMAGTCAAVSAARQGLSVALIQDRPVLGGNNSSEVRVHLGGGTNYEPYPRIGDITNEVGTSGGGNAGTEANYRDSDKLNVVLGEPNIDLFLNHRGNTVEMNGTTIVAVIAENTQTGQRLRFRADNFADCTGDACIGYLAGAEYEMTLTSTGGGANRMGRSNLWRFPNTGSAKTFPSCPWALRLESGDFPAQSISQWYWESGFFHDPFEKSEYIRDWNFRATYGAWDAMKNKMSGYTNNLPEWHAYVSGKRESRRLMGDVILDDDDFFNSVVYEDGCVPTTWGRDLHWPDSRYQPGFEGDEFISTYTSPGYTAPYWVPYRCLYSRNIDNLFMAGRNISVTHYGLGPVRVMRTTGMMGEVVGIAAYICKQYGVSPRGVYTHRLAEFKARLANGIPLPPGPFWEGIIGPNYALSSLGTTVSTASGTYAGNIGMVNDGQADTSNNSTRWLTSTVPAIVTFTLPEERYISAARIVSGWNNSGTPDSSINDFRFDYWNGTNWVEVGNSSVTGNTKCIWVGRFDAVQSRQFRLVVTRSWNNFTRLWEVELYHPESDLDVEGTVGLPDLAVFAEQWLSAGTGLSGDFTPTRDNLVDLSDLNILFQFWGW